MNLCVIEIEKAIGLGLLNPEVSNVLGVFLDAINDWPAPTSTLEEYVSRIEEVIGCVATKDSLEKYLADVNLQEDAWRAESLTVLLGVYQFYNGQVSLAEIVSQLKGGLD